MSLLTDADHAFFAENGYVRLNGVVPETQCRAVIDALWEHLGIDRSNPADWYRPPMPPGGMVEIYQHQTLWDNRQHPRVYQAFSEILGEEKLWVSIDRANLKVPAHPSHPEYDHKGFIHWDCDSSQPPARLRVQGVLYLADTAADQGGFQCVPALFRDFDAWLKTQPEDRDVRHPDMTGLETVPVPGKAGDLVIWNVMLAHGNGHNVSGRPRYAQYVSMYPAPAPAAADDERRADRVRQWREHAPPKKPPFPGDPREIEEKFGRTAELTPLGRKLLGVDAW